jgi:hypothetical protein
VLKTDVLDRTRSPRAVTRTWWPVAGVVLLVLAAATITRADADLWGHVRFGLDTLRDHRLTAIDPYSFTQDLPWLNHEWLSELQMGLAYAIAGNAGLSLLKAALAFGTFAIIWSSLRGAANGARIVVIVLVMFGTIHMTSSLRPQLWTFLSFALLCRAISDPFSRLRRWLPVLFAFWANTHGGWVVGLGVLGVWAGVEMLIKPETRRAWILIIVASALATLCTPYGWKLWEFVARTVRVSRDIDEWRSLWGTPVLNWVPWFVAVGAIVWTAARRSASLLPVVAVLSMLAYGSARVMRIESLFISAASILLAPLVIARWPARLVRLPVDRSRYEPVVALVMFLVPAVGSGVIAARSVGCLPTMGDWAPDAEPVALLARNAGGRLVTHFNWGEYALWHLGPRLRISMDGRRETVYSDLRIAEHDAVIAGTAAGLETLAAWNPEYVWLPVTSDTTRKWLVQHGYRLALETARSFVAVRSDLPLLGGPSTSRIEGTLPGCFPG